MVAAKFCYLLEDLKILILKNANITITLMKTGSRTLPQNNKYEKGRSVT